MDGGLPLVTEGGHSMGGNEEVTSKDKIDPSEQSRNQDIESMGAKPTKHIIIFLIFITSIFSLAFLSYEGRIGLI